MKVYCEACKELQEVKSEAEYQHMFLIAETRASPVPLDWFGIKVIDPEKVRIEDVPIVHSTWRKLK